jgi:hypothetical protein
VKRLQKLTHSLSRLCCSFSGRGGSPTSSEASQDGRKGRQDHRRLHRRCKERRDTQDRTRNGSSESSILGMVTRWEGTGCERRKGDEKEGRSCGELGRSATSELRRALSFEEQTEGSCSRQRSHSWSHCLTIIPLGTERSQEKTRRLAHWMPHRRTSLDATPQLKLD